MRHGQAISNVKALCSCLPEKFKNPITKLGRQMAKESALKLKKMINQSTQRAECSAPNFLVFNSPLLRCKQTAEIVGKIFGIKPKIDKRLQEIGFGIFNNKRLEGMWMYFKKEEERIKQAPPGGETYEQILKRIWAVVEDIEKKYSNKTILLISHEGPSFLLQGKFMGLSIPGTIKKFPSSKRIHKAEIRKLYPVK